MKTDNNNNDKFFMNLIGFTFVDFLVALVTMEESPTYNKNYKKKKPNQFTKLHSEYYFDCNNL